jgi:hypothetical protein
MKYLQLHRESLKRRISLNYMIKLILSIRFNIKFKNKYINFGVFNVNHRVNIQFY